MLRQKLTDGQWHGAHVGGQGPICHRRKTNMATLIGLPERDALADVV
jgi:hypothetical protein